MRNESLLQRYAYATVTSIVLVGLGTAATAQDPPSYMEPISGRTASSPAETATKNVLALNTGMFELYDDAAQIFQRNLLSKHPVILGLFSGAGGRFILYRPGQAPLEAPSVPIVYQLLMGRDARAAIIAERAKRGTTPFLPPVVPWNSRQWPMLVTPGPGPASLADLP